MKIVHWLVGLGTMGVFIACDHGESGTAHNVSQTTGGGGAGGEHSDGLGGGVPSNTVAGPNASTDTDTPTNTGAPTTVEPPADTGSAQNDGTSMGGASADSSELPFETDTSTDVVSPASDSMPTDDGEPTDNGDSEEFTATAEDTETLVEDATDPRPDAGTTPVDEGEVFMCMPDAEEDGCEFCVQSDCCDERSECAADEQCSAEWDGMKICMAERELRRNPVADPMAIVQECIVDVAGGELAASDALYALLSCVGSPFFEGNADDNRIEGDGMCTWACYGVDTLEPVAADPEFDFP